MATTILGAATEGYLPGRRPAAWGGSVPGSMLSFRQQPSKSVRKTDTFDYLASRAGMCAESGHFAVLRRDFLAVDQVEPLAI
jgi:hypothetical protein